MYVWHWHISLRRSRSSLRRISRIGMVPSIRDLLFYVSMANPSASWILAPGSNQSANDACPIDHNWSWIARSSYSAKRSFQCSIALCYSKYPWDLGKILLTLLMYTICMQSANDSVNSLSENIPHAHTYYIQGGLFSNVVWLSGKYLTIPKSRSSQITIFALFFNSRYDM